MKTAIVPRWTSVFRRTRSGTTFTYYNELAAWRWFSLFVLKVQTSPSRGCKSTKIMWCFCVESTGRRDFSIYAPGKSDLTIQLHGVSKRGEWKSVTRWIVWPPNLLFSSTQTLPGGSWKSPRATTRHKSLSGRNAKNKFRGSWISVSERKQKDLQACVPSGTASI